MTGPSCRGLAALALAAAAAGCVDLSWRRARRGDAVPPEALRSLRPGEDDLADCLERLGAPNQVFEHEIDGLALAYGAERSTALGFGAAARVAGGEASFDYERGRGEMEGWVLFFDAEWRLIEARRGRLGELTRGRRARRPAAEQDPSP